MCQNKSDNHLSQQNIPCSSSQTARNALEQTKSNGHNAISQMMFYITLIQTFQIHNKLRMSQKIKYKIISFTSEQQQYPVSSIQVPGSDGWQTKRFCNYPQQVTLQFYGVAHITKIQIIADTRKIPTTVDVLYYDPTESATQSRFSKYGSLQFSRNQSGRIHQQKTVMVDVKCLYLRFLFHKPYKNKQNFFSQVSIHQIAIYGGETSIGLDSLTKKAETRMNTQTINEEQDEFVYKKLMEIQSKKQKAIQNQDYDEAERCKQIMINIKKLSYILKDFKTRKQQAIEKQKYDEAKKIKESIEQTKIEIQELINDDMDQPIQEEQQNDIVDHDVQGNQFVGLEINQMLHKEAMQDSRVSRKSHKTSRVSHNKSLNKSKANYDERVIPTLNKIKTEEMSEFPDQNQESNKAQLQAQEIDGKYLGDAQLMQPFFDEDTIRKFFSKHWQLKQQSLQVILSNVQSKAKDQSIIKCLLRIVINSISQMNFKVALQSLNVFNEALKINSTTHKLARNPEMNTDLDKILSEIIKKMSDNNAKIKTNSQSIFQQMVKSSLYGVQICSLALMKNKAKTKLSNKQQVQRLKSLNHVILNYGLGNNGVPYSVIDYATEKLSNPGVQVRNEAVLLLAHCANIDEQRVYQKLENKKGIFLQQIEAKRQQLNGKPKNK